MRACNTCHCGCHRSGQEQRQQQQAGGQVVEGALIEAGRWRGRPRWAAAPEPRDVVTGAPCRAALLGATNRQGLVAGHRVPAPVSSPAVQPVGFQPADAAPEATCHDDNVLMGSPQRCPPLRSAAAHAVRVTQATEVSAAKAPKAAAASTASASVLLGSVVMPGMRQKADSGTFSLHDEAFVL